MIEVLFSACVISAAWIGVATGNMDYGSAGIISVMMYLWQMLCAIHKTLCEIRYKAPNVK